MRLGFEQKRGKRHHRYDPYHLHSDSRLRRVLRRSYILHEASGRTLTRGHDKRRSVWIHRRQRPDHKHRRDSFHISRNFCRREFVPAPDYILLGSISRWRVDNGRRQGRFRGSLLRSYPEHGSIGKPRGGRGGLLCGGGRLHPEQRRDLQPGFQRGRISMTFYLQALFVRDAGHPFP